MADQRFFTLAGPFQLGQLAEMTGSVLTDPSSAMRVVVDVAPIGQATVDHLSFLDNKKYIDSFKATKAGACFVRTELASFAPAGTACLTHKNPYKAYAIAAAAFYPAAPMTSSRAKTAIIHPTAKIGDDCLIEDGVLIDANVVIGNRCHLQAHAVIRQGVTIGDDCDIGTHVYITHALIGNKVRIYSGARIGRPGFGFAMDQAGFVSVPQLGRVVIESEVEVGANTTIDRGAGPDTVIGQGTRIDNLVQIGHNVKIGKYCVIVSQVGISGSTEIGDFVILGGQAGVAGHLKIGQGAQIAAKAGISRDIPAGEQVMGYPAMPIKQFMRQTVMLTKMVTGKRSEKE